LQRLRLSQLDRTVLRLCVAAFLVFWTLPLAFGTWLLQGYTLHFTIYDAAAMTLMLCYFSWEMIALVRRAVRSL
jgi:hypothetical protein